jgi:hypothetical protein
MEAITTIPTQTSSNPILTLEQIRQQYPQQWVLIADPELDENLEVIRGEIVFTTPNKEELYQHLSLCKNRNSALEYTGECNDAVVLI